MKTIRAYGGKITIERYTGGWSWDARRNERLDPPRAMSFGLSGRTVYMPFMGVRAFGECRSLRDARRAAVNVLRR